MVHDPRAPRLAAAATLVAALTVILTAVNLVLDVAGTPGFSLEEAVGLSVMVVMLVVARLAGQERVIPELNPAHARPDAEAFDTLVSAAPPSDTGSVNPTTASILTSILGENQTTDQAQVSSAISTLSSGEFGAEVQRTMAAVEAANQTKIAPREAAPADEETGQTLERVLVKPVPLPGQDAAKVRDPSTIPGLQPGRAFRPMASPVCHCQPKPVLPLLLPPANLLHSQRHNPLLSHLLPYRRLLIHPRFLPPCRPWTTSSPEEPMNPRVNLPSACQRPHQRHRCCRTWTISLPISPSLNRP